MDIELVISGDPKDVRNWDDQPMITHLWEVKNCNYFARPDGKNMKKTIWRNVGISRDVTGGASLC